MNPPRVCKEFPVIFKTHKMSTVPKEPTTSPPSSVLLQLRNSPASSSPLPKISVTVQPTSEPIFTVSEPSIVVNHYPTEHTDMTKSHSLAPQSPSQRNAVSFTPQCNPPCQNGGKCVLSIANGDSTCDCSKTPFWGGDCSRGK